MNIEFDLTGQKCNEYPHLTIAHNGHVLFNDYVQEHVALSLQIVCEDVNIITMSGIQKSQGQNNKWDTKVDSWGTVIEDKALLINSIKLDSFAMSTQWVRDLKIYQDNGAIVDCNQGMWNNGCLRFQFTKPILNWIIEENIIKYETATCSSLENFSGQDRFHYDYICQKIASIRKIINDQNTDL